MWAGSSSLRNPVEHVAFARQSDGRLHHLGEIECAEAALRFGESGY